MRKLKLFLVLYVVLDLLTGYAGFFPLPLGVASAQATPANPISTQQITMPVFTLNPAPAIGASIQLVGNPGPKTVFYWVVAKYAVGNATLAGPFAITNAPNTFSGANSVKVAPLLPTGSTSYDLLKTSTTIPPGGVCACAVIGGTGVAVGTVTNDTNTGTGAYTVTTFDINTLTLQLQNEVQSAGVSHLILRLSSGTMVQDLSAPAPAFPLLGPADTLGAPNYSWAASPTTGMFLRTPGVLGFTAGNSEVFEVYEGGTGGPDSIAQIVDPQGGLCWGPTPGTPDACMWRLGSSQIGLGTFTVGNFTGIFRSGGISGGNTGNITGYNIIQATTQIVGATFNTATNCSSAASPAVCASAAAGRVVIAAAATTVQVNVTSVTAASEITVTFDEGLTGLGTCNTAVASESATYFVSARSAGASFTIKTSAAPVANPACLTYTIKN